MILYKNLARSFFLLFRNLTLLHKATLFLKEKKRITLFTDKKK